MALFLSRITVRRFCSHVVTFFFQLRKCVVITVYYRGYGWTNNGGIFILCLLCFNGKKWMVVAVIGSE